jgi:hypothetical protein
VLFHLREFFARFLLLVSWMRQRTRTGIGRTREAGSNLRHRGKRVAELEAMVVRATATIETLTTQMRQLEAAVEALGADRRVNLQLPFTERAQALKMVRDGRPARQVASALGVPQGEILLLTRVQEIQNGPALLLPAPPPAPPPPAPRRNLREDGAARALRRIANGVGETA